MIDYQQVFENNRKWAAEKKAADSTFFAKLLENQQPGFLYIGCSDSRVLPEEITGAQAGEMLVHRNVANLVNPSDLNTTSVIQFAVEKVKVAHIVVCGHYECVGIKVAMEDDSEGPLESWFQSIRLMAGQNREELEGIESMDARYRRLVELNAETQCRNILKLPVIQKARSKGHAPAIHAWVYNMHTGELSDLNFQY